MTQVERPSRRPARRGGFTLIELLVVIGIIVILIAILLPVIGAVRKAGYVTATRNQISTISAAIQAYYGDYHAYPGPVAETDIDAGTVGSLSGPTAPPYGGPTPITSTENLTVALSGGFTVGFTSGTASTFNFNAANVGQGPQSLNFLLNSQKQPTAYYQPKNEELAPQDTSGNYLAFGTLDSAIPEFLDHIPGAVTGSNGNFQTGPILYMRARVAATGIVNTTGATSTAFQYNFAQLKPYGFTTVNSADFAPGTYPDSITTYFANPSIAGQPKGKDSFLMISAGADRIFGTKDDIVFGQ